MSADGAQLLLISHYSLLIDLRLLGMTRFYKKTPRSFDCEERDQKRCALF